LASERVAELNAELNTSLDKALATARAGLASMQEEVSHLARERDQIARLVQDKGAKLSLRAGDSALEALQLKKTDLEHFIARIEGVQKEAASAATLGLSKMLERARLFEAEADFDQAISLYEKVLKASPDQ